MILGNVAAGFMQLTKMGALPWFGGIALTAFLAGTSLGAVGGYKWNEGRALKAELALSRSETSLADAHVAARDREDRIMRAAKEQYDAQTSSIAGVADELRRLSTSVRVCASVSNYRPTVAQSSAGPAQAPASSESRPADVVLQELATEFARRADSNAAAYNSLMERWEKLAAPPPAN